MKAGAWITLRLCAVEPQTVVEITDESGRPPRRLTLPAATRVIESPWLQQLVQDKTSGRSQRFGRPPVFLTADAALDSFDLKNVFAPVLQQALSVRLARVPVLPRGPFTLPLKLLLAGPDADLWRGTLLTRDWASGDAVRESGLQIQTAERDLDTAVLGSAPHIVVTRDPDEVLEVAGRSDEASRPRLLVWLDNTMDSPAPAVLRQEVPGLAVMRVDASQWTRITEAIVQLVLGFTHDAPLHEIAADIRSSVQVAVELTADEYSLHNIRLSEAVRALRRDALALEARWPLVRMDPNMRPWIDAAAKSRDFLGESHAFVPMAGLLQQRAAVRSAFEAKIAAQRASTTRGPFESFATRGIAVEPPRAVQVALERLDTSPFLESLSRDSTLAAGAAYQLRVHVGLPVADSLVEDPVPIDPSLGPPDDHEGYALEVAIQGKDFLVESDRVQPLRLPKAGGSEPVYFDVRTPTRTGGVELRICIYHQNHLAQSYLLSAEVSVPGEMLVQRSALIVRLEMARVAKLDDAEEALRPRALSLGVNASDGTHNFIVKGTGAAGEVSLQAATFQESSDEIRKVLAAAATDLAVNPPAARTYPKIAKGAATPADVAVTVRKLAAWGMRLHSAFFDRFALPGSKLRADLVRLVSSVGEAIQVVRFKFEDVFFWTLLYDWDPPADPNADVCLGWKIDATGVSAPCGHDASSGLYCVRGFWGVRHRIEECVEQPAGSVTTISIPTSGKPVRVVADPGVPGGSSLPGDLVTDLGAANVEKGPGVPATLLDLLFDKPSERPALLILLGHHERQARPAGGPLSRFRVDGTPTWLSEDDVRARARKKADAWSQPRSLVLMMACDSAATGLTTLTDFVTAWTVSGAGAIVGTDAVVGSRLAADFARRFSQSIWKDKKKLGDAMTAIRGELLAEGNPLAFLFHAIGDVDLAVN